MDTRGRGGVFRKGVWRVNLYGRSNAHAQTFCYEVCESLFSDTGTSCLSRVNKVMFRLAQR